MLIAIVLEQDLHKLELGEGLQQLLFVLRLVWCPGLSCLWAGFHKGSSQQATGTEAGGVLVSCGELQPDQASLRGSSLEVNCPADAAQHTGPRHAIG